MRPEADASQSKVLLSKSVNALIIAVFTHFEVIILQDLMLLSNETRQEITECSTNPPLQF
jgi:hypothetical protein